MVKETEFKTVSSGSGGAGDVISFAADGYTPADIAPGATDWQQVVSMIAGPLQGTDTAVRIASVLDGISGAMSADDNPLLTLGLVRGLQSHDDPILQAPILIGANADENPQSAVGADDDLSMLSCDREGRLRVTGGVPLADKDGAEVVLAGGDNTAAAANANRQYFEVLNNTAAVITIKLFAGAAGASDFEILAGGNWFMESPAIYTGEIHLFSAAGGNVNIIEF